MFLRTNRDQPCMIILNASIVRPPNQMLTGGSKSGKKVDWIRFGAHKSQARRIMHIKMKVNIVDTDAAIRAIGCMDILESFVSIPDRACIFFVSRQICKIMSSRDRPPIKGPAIIKLSILSIY
jgi:hypothetical protein